MWSVVREPLGWALGLSHQRRSHFDKVFQHWKHYIDSSYLEYNGLLIFTKNKAVGMWRTCTTARSEERRVGKECPV